MNWGRSAGMAWWSATTIFVSAFLLFQVQPVVTKKILPWFGGSPAVWTTCVLFFQLVLLGGYAYAHLMTHRIASRWQAVFHLGVVLFAVLLLPLFPPSNWWKPTDGDLPALRILLLLAAVVGLPYFVLSTTGPLVQAWFARLYPGRASPRATYAAKFEYSSRMPDGFSLCSTCTIIKSPALDIAINPKISLFDEVKLQAQVLVPVLKALRAWSRDVYLRVGSSMPGGR